MSAQFRLILRTGPYHWNPGFDTSKKTLFLLGIAETECPNIIAVEWITLTIKWPWLRWGSCFTNNPGDDP